MGVDKLGGGRGCAVGTAFMRGESAAVHLVSCLVDPVIVFVDR